MDGVDYVVLVSRWLHLLAAMIIVGGSVFMWVAARSRSDSGSRGASEPTGDSGDSAGSVQAGTLKRWAMVVHPCIAMLLLTGGLNFYLLVLRPKVPPVPYHWVFGIKLFSAMAVFFILSAILGRAEGFAKMREARSRWLGVIVVLGALIVLLSGWLSQIRP